MPNDTASSAPAIKGVYVALATPRKPESIEADAGTLLEYIDTLATVGIDGFVLFGTTGEFVHYSNEERFRILSLAVKRSRVPLFVNVSHTLFEGAIELAENAILAQAHGLLVMPPYFFRYSDEQIFAFYENFVRQIDGALPIYLYNIPFFTNPMSAALLERLLLTGAFAGIKDSSGEWPLFEAIRRARQNVHFQNIVGNDRIYAQARAQGADGIVSGVAAAVPELMVALDRAVVAADQIRTQNLDRYLQEFMLQLDRFPATVVIKQAADARGWKQDQGAFPFDDQTNLAINDFRRWFEAWLPRVLSDCQVTA